MRLSTSGALAVDHQKPRQEHAAGAVELLEVADMRAWCRSP